MNENGTDGMVVFKREGYRNVDVMKMQDVSYFKSLRYVNQKSESIYIKISKNQDKIFLNNESDNILYHQDRQEVLNWFKKKKVYKIVSTDDNNFIAVCSKPYDDKFDILSTKDSSYIHSIPIRTAPGIFKFFDIKQVEKTVSFICLRDTELFIQQIALDQEVDNSYYYSYYKLEEFHWPYICFIVNDEELLILSVFNPQKFYRLVLPDQVMVQSFISERLNLFLMTISPQTNKFSMYMIDLDTFKMSPKPVFSFPMSDVIDNPNLYKIHVRSTSEKELNNYNLKTIAFMKFATSLYSWTEAQGFKKMMNVNYLKSVEEDKIFVGTKDTKMVSRIKISFSNYKVTQVYQEKDPQAQLVQLSLDFGKIYLLIKIKNDLEIFHYIKILDYNPKSKYRTLYKVRMENNIFVGEMISGHYHIINDLMYYKNSLLSLNFSPQGEITFNNYDEVLPLNKDEEVSYFGIITTYNYNRVVYMKKNSKQFTPKHCTLLPFLKEKKVIFNCKNTISQFCTMNYDSYRQENKLLIYNLNPYEFRYFAYTTKGQLIAHHNIEKIIMTSGEIVTVSHDGLKFLHQNATKTELSMYEMTLLEYKHIFTTDLNKAIAQNHEVVQYLGENKCYVQGEIVNNYNYSFQINDKCEVVVMLEQQGQDILNDYIHDYQSQIQSDFLRQRALKKIFDYQLYKKRRRCFFLHLLYNEMEEQDFQVRVGDAFSTDDIINGCQDFLQWRFSQGFIVLWNLQNVHIYDLTHQTLRQIKLHVPLDDLKRIRIKHVKVSGKKDSKLVITLSQNHNLDAAIIYDFQKDIELDSYDLNGEAEVFFDMNGEIYLLDKDSVVFDQASARVKAYDLNVSAFDKQYLYQGLDKGFRVEPRNFNFLLMRNFMALGQSYFQLIVIENTYGYDLTDKIFHLDSCYFIENRETELHMYATDSLNLNFILNKYETECPALLEQLLIANHKGQTPLHIALENHDHKSVSLILKRLGQVQFSNPKNFKRLFTQLLEYDAFTEYLNECFFQTIQMKHTHSLPMKRNQFVFTIVYDTFNSYLDHQFFDKITKNQLNDSETNQPVTLKGLDVGWIFSTKEGEQFLVELSNTENIIFYETESVKTVVSYLWLHYYKKILSFVAVPYLLYHGLFLLLIFYNEKFFNSNDNSVVFYNLSQKNSVLIICIVFLVFWTYQAYILAMRFRYEKMNAFYGIWIYNDVSSLLLNLAIVILTLVQSEIRQIRRVESAAALLMWLKFLYFMRVHDSTAYLVRIIKEILTDMFPFMLIFVVSLLGCANAFNMISYNQIDDGEAASNILYSTFAGAVQYVYLAAIGSTDNSAFQGSDLQLLWFYLFISTIFLLVILLNLLIAIMSQTFSRVQATTTPAILRERLQLIIENYFLPSIPNAQKIKYLIQIKNVIEGETQEQQMVRLNKEIIDTKKMLANAIEKIHSRIEQL